MRRLQGEVFLGLEFHTSLRNNDAVLYCKGQIIEGETGVTFKTEVAKLLRQRPKVIVDLGQIQEMDGTGLAVIVGLYSCARTAKATVKFVNLSIPVDHAGPHKSEHVSAWQDRKAG